MSRIPAVLLLLCAACASAPRTQDAPAAELRLLEVHPAIGSLVDADTEIRIRVAYRVPGDMVGSSAVLTFATTTGVSTARNRPQPPLSAAEGVLEFVARPSEVYGELARPITAAVVLMRTDIRPGTPVPTEELPESVRSEQLRDSAAAARGGRIGVRIERGPARFLARSPVVFYNGQGPARSILPAAPFEVVLAEYLTFAGNKALALAVDDHGERSWGYSFGYEQADSAVVRALHECDARVARRPRPATCRVYAVGNAIVYR